MMIPKEFDESNKDRRKRLFNQRMKTANNFNLRIKQFLNKDVDPSISLTKDQKLKIFKAILAGFIVE